MNRTTALALVFLVGAGGFLSISPAGGLILPSTGSETALLDPLAETPDDWNAAVAPDGDYAIAYDTTSDVPKFAISQPGSNTFTKHFITMDTGFSNPEVAAGNEADEWYVAFHYNATIAQLWRTTDDGTSWTLRQNVTVTDLADISLLTYGGTVGLAVADTGTEEALWYRTNDDGATWDKEAVVIHTVGTGSLKFVDVVAWDAGLQYLISHQGSTTEHHRLNSAHSDDGGSFWSTASTDCFQTTNTFESPISAVTNGVDRGYAICFLGGDPPVQLAAQTYLTYDDDGFDSPKLALGGTVTFSDNSMILRDFTLYFYADAGPAWRIYSFNHVDDSASNFPTVSDSVPTPQGSKVTLDVSGDTLIATAKNNALSGRFEVHMISLEGDPEGDASVAVDGLVGFDVDHTGQNIITRELGTDLLVKTYSASALSNLASLDTNCNRVNGVATLSDHVTFLNCDGSGDIEFLSIRSATLGDAPGPTTEQNCTQFTFGAYCDQDLPESEFAEDGVNLTSYNEMASVAAIPFDYSQGTGSTLLAAGETFAAWMFTDINGGAGIMAYTWRDDADDKVNFARAQIGATDTTPIACNTQDADGRTFLYAAQESTNAKGYRVTFSTGDADIVEVDMALVFAGVTSTSNAAGVGCGEGYFAVYGANNDGTVTIWPRGATTPQVTLTGVGAPMTSGLRGPVAMNDGGAESAPGGPYVAAVNTAGTVRVFAGNGTTAYETTLPSGTFRGIALDGTASNLWLATSEFITRHTIFEFTTGNETTYIPDGVEIIDGPTGDGGTGGGGGAGGFSPDTGIFAGSDNGIAQAFGVEGEAAGAVLGSIMILVCTAAGAALFLKWGIPTFGAAIGALLGVVLAWKIGFFDPLVAFFVFIGSTAIILLLFLGIRGRR